MRCRRCDYSLWNMKGRLCPECGDPFKPSDYEFVVNAVKFLCPHCEQDYYGEGPRGRLVPFEFDCVRCNEHISMDDMILLPLEGIDEARVNVPEMPWRARAQIGHIKAWFQTAYRSLFMPPVLMRYDPGPSVAAAWLFLVVTHVLYALPTVFLCTPLALRIGSGFDPMAVVFVFLFLLAAPIILAAVWGLLAHGLLRLTGPTKHGLGGTYQAICYASAADIIKAVPGFNFYFFYLGWIWWTVSATLMVVERQQVQGWRASLAVILPIAAAIAIPVIGVFGGVMFLTSVMGTGTTFQAQINPVNVRAVGVPLLTWRESRGAWPDHAAELLLDGAVGPHAFTLDASFTQPMSVPVGLESLQTFQYITPEEKQTAVLHEIEALPDNVIAHRFGDFVFTYHGIDPAADDGQLWIVIASPDPAVQHWELMNMDVVVTRLDGVVDAMDQLEFQNALPIQNLLREQHGLEPLPPPSDITHGDPAVSK